MTNQEAIEAIKLARSQVEWDYPMDYAAAFDKAIEALEQEPILLSSELEKNSKELEKDFGELDCIGRTELLKAMDTWDKFGYTAQYGLERLDKDDKGFVPYVKYEDMVKCVKGMPSVTPQKPEIVPIAEIKYDEDKLKELVNKAVLSVTPQERKGHWIENAPQYDMLNPQYICSECGNAHTRTTPYCEMCGAKMIEPQESEVNNG